LFLELLDVEAVRASEDPPIEIAELVSRLIRPVLRELHRKAAERGAMEPRQEPLDHARSVDFEAPQLSHFSGVEQIEAGAGWHGRRKLTDARASRPGDTVPGGELSPHSQVPTGQWVP